VLYVESLEAVTANTLWVLDPPIPYLLPELGRRGYMVLGGAVPMIVVPPTVPPPPNVIAVKGFTRVLYDPSKRVLGVEGSDEYDVYRVLEEVEEVLRIIGADPKRAVLFYEVIARARIRGCRLSAGDINIGAQGEYKLTAVPLTYVQRSGDPLDKSWLSLELRPLWTSWGSEQVVYEVLIVFRSNREEASKFVKQVRTFLAEALKAVSEKFCSK